MSAPARVSARGVSKVFARYDTSRRKGVSTEGPAALRHLLRESLRPRARVTTPAHDDGRFFRALDDVSFDVAPGEVLGIIGRNGAGKSTLLKILARVLHPSSGRVTIRGRVVSMLELGIGFSPEMTVRQNIQAQGRLAGLSGGAIGRVEDQILEFSGLADAADVALGVCPGGSAVQLGFAAMIGFGADVILADEVLAVGDSQFRRSCEERIRTAGDSGESILFVSHDLAAIQRICTRTLWIDRGRLVQIGPTDEVVGAYTAELLAGRLLPPLSQDGLAASCLVLDLRLLDAQRAPVGALQLAEAGYIDCLFRLSRPDVAASVTIELWQGKQHVFSSVSQPVTAPRTATFRAGIRIPADLLNEQRYQARLRVVVTSLAAPDQPVVVADQQLDFPAMNPRPQQSVWNDWPWGRAGLVSPRLDWRVNE